MSIMKVFTAATLLVIFACAPVATACKAFTVFSLENFPIVMPNTGTSVVSYNNANWGTATYPVQSASSSCGPFPSTFKRGVISHHGSTTVKFSSPVSSFYIASIHQNQGDDITVTNGQVVATTPTCGTGSGQFYKVTLTSPLTTVVLHDVDPGGGSGVSFMFAECKPTPTENPTSAPTPSPTLVPTANPNSTPTALPTALPTPSPTPLPTPAPTPHPTTAKPTLTPTVSPTVSTPTEPAECSSFTVFDMGSLPALMTGPDLIGYTNAFYGTQTWTQTGSSQMCGLIPSTYKRAFTSHSGSASLMFASPVTEFYIATQHDNQPGDTITVTNGVVIATTPTCSTGTGRFFKVVLNTPSSVAVLHDVDAGGGTGVSFLVAECKRTAPPTPPPTQPTGVCKTFKVFDMGALPALMTGPNLVSYSNAQWSTTTWSQSGSTNACGPIPSSFMRGGVSHLGSTTLTFASPVSSFYIATQHQQVGDTITVTNGVVVATLPTCSTGSGQYFQVLLNSPSTTVVLHDLDNGGGSGVSVMVAECKELQPDVSSAPSRSPSRTKTTSTLSPSPPPASPPSTKSPTLRTFKPTVAPPTKPPTKPPTFGRCTKFKVYDMASLPAVLTHNPMLVSYSNAHWGTQTYPVQGTSNACGPFPSTFHRGLLSHLGSATITFAAPVTSFYIASLHQQVGDDITVSNGVVIAATPACTTGSGQFYQVTLNQPSQTVVLHDVGTGGGAGVSFMVAECDEPTSAPTPSPTAAPAPTPPPSQPDDECKTFKVFDMSVLPVPLTTIPNLIAYNNAQWGTQTWAAQSANTQTCGPFSSSIKRGFISHLGSTTLTFAAPVTSFYIASLHQQVGDDITVSNGVVTATTPTCSTGSGQFYQVTLNSPSATVMLHDIDGGGGSGVSFMLAECDKGDPVPPPTAKCDGVFKVFDMAALPAQMTSATVVGYENEFYGTQTWPQAGSSSTCGPIPSTFMRAFTSHSGSAVLTFATPVSDFFIAAQHQQVGDTITVSGGDVIAVTPTCSTGSGRFFKVVLGTPTTVVKLHDVESGGGTGVSFMVAECTTPCQPTPCAAPPVGCRYDNPVYNTAGCLIACGPITCNTRPFVDAQADTKAITNRTVAKLTFAMDFSTLNRTKLLDAIESALARSPFLIARRYIGRVEFFQGSVIVLVEFTSDANISADVVSKIEAGVPVDYNNSNITSEETSVCGATAHQTCDSLFSPSTAGDAADTTPIIIGVVVGVVVVTILIIVIVCCCCAKSKETEKLPYTEGKRAAHGNPTYEQGNPDMIANPLFGVDGHTNS